MDIAHEEQAIAASGGLLKLDALSPRGSSDDAGDGDDDGDRHSTSSDSSDDEMVNKMKMYIIQVRCSACGLGCG